MKGSTDVIPLREVWMSSLEGMTSLKTLYQTDVIPLRDDIRNNAINETDDIPPRDVIRKKTIIMETLEKVLEAMKQAGAPVNAGKIAELTGLDRKEVDKAMKQLKASGAIVSPKMCYWEPSK